MKVKGVILKLAGTTRSHGVDQLSGPALAGLRVKAVPIVQGSNDDQHQLAGTHQVQREKEGGFRYVVGQLVMSVDHKELPPVAWTTQ